METLWKFKTDRFIVQLDIGPCFDLDLSWDESGEVAEKIESGEFTAFDSTVRVFFDGLEIAWDHLGESIYANPYDFVTDHRDSDPNNRNCSLNGRNIGHYFPDMVSSVVKEARETLSNAPKLRTA